MTTISFSLTSRIRRALTLAAVCALTANTLLAQAPAVAPSPDLAGLAHVALRVHDLAASVAFYEKLGFVKAFELSKDGAVYEAFIKINDRQFIELYPANAKSPELGFLHVCFEGKNLQSVHDYYVAHGLTPGDVKTAGAGNLLFSMKGPVGPGGAQNMEYTQYMPGSLHSKDVGQHLGADRIATEIVTAGIPVDDLAGAVTFYKNKVGFTQVSAGSAMQVDMHIPGTDGIALALMPSTRFGSKAYIVFNTAHVKAAEMLKARGIAYGQLNRNFPIIEDPDGNHIAFQ